MHDVQTWNGIFETTHKPKKPLLKHYFTSFLKDFSTKNLVTLCKLLAIEITKLLKKLYVTLGRKAWIPQHEKKNHTITCKLTNDWMTTQTTKNVR